jgi:hypothetical protein
MVHIIPTVETISVVCLTEDQEDRDLILDLMVDLINMVSFFALFVRLFSNTFHESQPNYNIYLLVVKTSFIVISKFY